MKITSTFAALVLVSSLSAAQVLVVNVYEPMPGMASKTLENAREARAIHQEMGIEPSIGMDQLGNLHYVVAFENWSAWAAFQKKMQDNAEWAAFLAKIDANPSAELQQNYRMNIVAPAELGRVNEVFVYQPEPGRLADTIEAGMSAKAIHEKAGAKVSINVDRHGRAHYVMSFDSAEAWAKFQDTPNAEFDEFMAELAADPPARIVGVYAVTLLD